jgi:CBS domain-containing protein
MTSKPRILNPDTMLVEVAQKMRELDSGVMPVGEHDRPVGVLTDRDITFPPTAEGKGRECHTRV